MSASPRLLALAVIALAAVAPLLPFTPPYWVTLWGDIGLASLVAIGLVLLTGVGGMTSFGQAAFVGIGAPDRCGGQCDFEGLADFRILLEVKRALDRRTARRVAFLL